MAILTSVPPLPPAGSKDEVPATEVVAAAASETTAAAVTKPCCSEKVVHGAYLAGRYSVVYPLWAVWATVTTVLASPVLLCTIGGVCGRNSTGHPTYPIFLANIQCCEAMFCKCEEGRY